MLILYMCVNVSAYYFYCFYSPVCRRFPTVCFKIQDSVALQTTHFRPQPAIQGAQQTQEGGTSPVCQGRVTDTERGAKPAI